MMLKSAKVRFCIVLLLLSGQAGCAVQEEADVLPPALFIENNQMVQGDVTEKNKEKMSENSDKVTADENGVVAAEQEMTPAEYFLYHIEDDYIVLDGLKYTCEHIHVPDVIEGFPVREISAKAFFRCSNLVRVELPTSIEKIGMSAFQDCENLKEMMMPEGVSVEDWAFYGCSQLQDDRFNIYMWNDQKKLKALRQEEEKLADEVETLQAECQEAEKQITRQKETEYEYEKCRKEELMKREDALTEEIQDSILFIYSNYYTEMSKDKYEIATIEDTLTEQVISELVGNEYAAEATKAVRTGVLEGKTIEEILSDVESGLGAVAAKKLEKAFVDGVFGNGVSTAIELFTTGWSSEEQIQYQFNKATELKESELACFDELLDAEQIDIGLLEEAMLKAEELYYVLGEAETRSGKVAGADIWYEVWQKLKTAYRKCIAIEIEEEYFLQSKVLTNDVLESDVVAVEPNKDGIVSLLQNDVESELDEWEKLSISIRELKEQKEYWIQKRDGLVIERREKRPATWTELAKYVERLEKIKVSVGELNSLSLGAIKLLYDYEEAEKGASMTGVLDKLGGGIFGSIISGGMKEQDYLCIDALAEYNSAMKPYIQEAQIEISELRKQQERVEVLLQMANPATQNEEELFYLLRVLEKEITQLEGKIQNGLSHEVIKLVKIELVGEMIVNAYQCVLSENDYNRYELFMLEVRVQEYETVMRLYCTEEQIAEAKKKANEEIGVELIEIYTKLLLDFHGFGRYFVSKDRKTQWIPVQGVGECPVYGSMDKQSGEPAYFFFKEHNTRGGQLATYCFDRNGNLYSITDGEGNILVYLDGINVLKTNVRNPEEYVNAAFWLYQNFGKANFIKEYKEISMTYKNMKRN